MSVGCGQPDGAEPDGAEPDGAEPDGAEPDGAARRYCPTVLRASSRAAPAPGRRRGALGIPASGDVAYVEYRGDGQHVAYEQFGRNGPVMQGSKVKQLTTATFRINNRS